MTEKRVFKEIVQNVENVLSSKLPPLTYCLKWSPLNEFKVSNYYFYVWDSLKNDSVYFYFIQNKHFSIEMAFSTPGQNDPPLGVCP